jgi:hypothetical protein
MRRKLLMVMMSSFVVVVVGGWGLSPAALLLRMKCERSADAFSQMKKSRGQEPGRH